MQDEAPLPHLVGNARRKTSRSGGPAERAAGYALALAIGSILLSILTTLWQLFLPPPYLHVVVRAGSSVTLFSLMGVLFLTTTTGAVRTRRGRWAIGLVFGWLILRLVLYTAGG